MASTHIAAVAFSLVTQSATAGSLALTGRSPVSPPHALHSQSPQSD